MNGTITEMSRSVMATLTEFGFDLVGALIILIFGWMVASWAGRATRKAVDKSTRIDSTFTPILGHVVRYGILVFAGMAILGQFGIQTASLLTVLGTAGLAIGLALQGTLRDLASGFMILMHRPFRVEDHIEVNKLDGIVKHVGPFITVLETRDGVYLSVPNSTIWSNPIFNNTRNPTRRVQIVFRVDYSEDIDKVIAVLEQELKADARVLADPKTMVAVHDLAENSVNVVARAWTASPEFRKFALDFTKRIKKRFDQEGIKIPYPQRTITIDRNVKRPELRLVSSEPETAPDESAPNLPKGPAE